MFFLLMRLDHTRSPRLRGKLTTWVDIIILIAVITAVKVIRYHG
jgi:hypothetical protein